MKYKMLSNIYIQIIGMFKTTLYYKEDNFLQLFYKKKRTFSIGYIENHNYTSRKLLFWIA